MVSLQRDQWMEMQGKQLILDKMKVMDELGTIFIFNLERILA